jgi:putative component of toxin-antitoxin plasmid stabilization module
MEPYSIRVITYQEADGRVPLHDWLSEVVSKNTTALLRCRDLIVQLAEQGHMLRRPRSAPLRDEIYELRARVGRAHYRILYFFNGRSVAVLTNGCTKQQAIDSTDLDRAVRFKERFRAAPERHTYRPLALL